MSTLPPALRLPPWPDELLAGWLRRDAMTWLLRQRWPFWRARQLWLRWCEYTQERATSDDFRALKLAAPSETE